MAKQRGIPSNSTQLVGFPWSLEAPLLYFLEQRRCLIRNCHKTNTTATHLVVSSIRVVIVVTIMMMIESSVCWIESTSHDQIVEREKKFFQIPNYDNETECSF